MVMEVLGDDITPGQVKVIGGDDTAISEMESKTKSNSEQSIEEPIKFGLVDSSHGANRETKETRHVAATNLPKDAVDEWPAPKQIHTFYFVRFRSYEDPVLKSKLEQADKDLQKKNQARFRITEALRAKRSERSNVILQLKPLTTEDKRYRNVIDEKRQEMEPLHTALGKMRDANNAAREKGVGLCSSEEELNDLIKSLHYRMQHESNTLVVEKQLLKEIKQLEGTREKVIANAALKAKIQDSFGQKEVIQRQVKLIGADMDEVRKEQQSIKAQIKQLEEELNAINNEIISLEKELAAATEKRDKAYESLTELRKARDEANACFYRNRSLLNNAKDLAAKKDIAALEELYHREVEKFMSHWSSSKAFRDDYEKRILPSLDIRQLSRDGRMRNPSEKPILSEAQTQLSRDGRMRNPNEKPILSGAQPGNESERAPMKVSAKQSKEEVLPLQLDAVSVLRAQDEVIIQSTEVQPRGKSGHTEAIDDTYAIGKSQKELVKPNEIDAEKLKEMKREEEIAKAKMAMERKKKLVEKAAAKAAVRAQREAEKKMKEKEKRAKKKTEISESDSPAEQTESDSKISEPEEAEVKVDAPVPTHTQEQKEKVRYRNRPKVQNPLPKVMLKRKKSHPYWSWAAAAAAAAILAVVLVAAGYYYYVGRN